jgi:hypothetical protein
MKIFATILTLLAGTALQAQNFDVALIPDSLKTDADVVTRLEEKVFEIKSPAKAVEHERHVYTIFNEAGDRFANYHSYYNKFTSINYINGFLYDAKGKELKHVKQKDMQDLSGTGEENLITDTRYKSNDFYCRNYPYTVAYEEEDDINGILGIDDWMPQATDKIAVQYNKYTVIAPKDYVLRYKPMNGANNPVITEKDDKKIYTWETKNLPAKTDETLSPAWRQLWPYVLIEPSIFERAGYNGDKSTWDGFGKFINNLYQGRDVLPENTKQKVHELTDNLHNPKEKIAVLYDYLQKNTRYISVQLGIGGFQPFDANYVATNKYGDCKALSNFMVSLLKEANLKANSVIIQAGRQPTDFDTSFTCDPFDHVICCVPLEKDTVWLECTSQTLPPGYLSGFTANRWGLMLTETGGKLVHTPKYGLADNLQIRKINASLNEEGHLTATVHTQYKALQQDDIHGLINALSKEKVMEYLKGELELPTYDVASFNYTEDKQPLPSVFETLNITANIYAQVSGKRIFIMPNVMTRAHNKLRNDEPRKYPIQINYAYTDIDTVEIAVPSGYNVEALPQASNVTSKFGRYSSTAKVVGDKIFYCRTRENYSNQFPASDFTDLAKFYETMYKADRAKIVLIKKE